MRQLDILIIVLTVGNTVLSILFIALGSKKKKKENKPFEFGNLFKKIPRNEVSGTQMIVEGTLMLAAAMIIQLYWLIRT